MIFSTEGGIKSMNGIIQRLPVSKSYKSTVEKVFGILVSNTQKAMPQLYPTPRVFTPLAFYRHVVRAFRFFPHMLRSQRKGIVSKASIRSIMLGNIYGIAFDGLMRRLSGKRMEGSKLVYELGILFGIFLMIPVAFVHSCCRSPSSL